MNEKTYLEEGDPCPECGWEMVYPKVAGCYCHINPPCDACTSNRLTCTGCGFQDWQMEEER